MPLLEKGLRKESFKAKSQSNARASDPAARAFFYELLDASSQLTLG